jgi:tetratricopeptide (TPR) repeat protein
VSDFTEAIRLEPTADLYDLRGGAYFMLKQWQRAIADYTEVIRLNPRNPDTYTMRASSYARVGEHQKAIEDYTEALRHWPGWRGVSSKLRDHFMATAYWFRGEEYGKLRQYSQALADYTEALRVAPAGWKDAAAVFGSRGSALYEMGDWKAAADDYRKGCELKDQAVCDRLQRLQALQSLPGR